MLEQVQLQVNDKNLKNTHVISVVYFPNYPIIKYIEHQNYEKSTYILKVGLILS